MFSIENTPTDLPCPPLKPCNARSSHKRGLPEADLSKSAIVNDTSLSNFSIREYVLSSRGKDIKSNWPFSPKTLQLCLKYGVKDLLPPFQPLGKVRTQSIDGCTVENAKLENQTLRSFNGEPSQRDHPVVLNSSSSCRYQEGNDLLSTKTSISPSEIDSIPTFGSSSSPLEVDLSGPPVLLKVERTAKSLSKKCRFSVKNGVQAYQNSCEDIVSICKTKSETMASKTCPVCRTFSSPSNTTLNAHIDQCLSVESTPKGSLDSRSTKHRFKPRKTKLLVDIYDTASPCTLEDLDRRNGTTWAVGSRLPTPDIVKSEMHYEGKRNRVQHKVSAMEGGVYIDSKGTKLRILSEFSHPSLSKVRESHGSTRAMMEDEGEKSHPPKRKKYQKFRKIAAHRKTIFPPELSAQIDKSHDRYNGVEEGNKMDKNQLKHWKSHDSGCLRRWICSKRTSVAKKVTSKEGHQCIGDMKMKKISVQRCTNSSENPIFSPEDTNMMEVGSPLCEDQILDINGRSSGRERKKMESPIFVESSTFSGDRHLMKSKIVNGDSCDILSKDCRATALKATKFHSLSEKMSSPVKKRSALEKSQIDFRPKIDGKLMSLHSETDRRCRIPENSFESPSEIEEINEVLPKSKVHMKVSQRNEIMGLRSLSSGYRISKHCNDGSLDSSVHGGFKHFDGNRVVEYAREMVQNHDESQDQSMNPNVYEPVNSSRTRSSFFQFTINSKQPVYEFEEQDLPTKLKFDDQSDSICMEDRDIHAMPELHSEASPGNPFDPILIPGPPGSFLPSPGKMQSDEFQGISSLTCSQIHSSQDQRVFADRDSSDSPFSASSIFSTKSRSVVSEGNLKLSMENSSNIALATNTGLNLSYQQPQSLRQMGYNLNRSPNNLDERPEIPHLCCCNRSEKVTAPIGNSPESIFPFISSPGMKFSDYGNFESATSSSSNSVLRLMGKNLMVMNKNEDAYLRALPVEEIHRIGDGHANCVPKMAAYGSKYSRGFGASLKLTPGM